MGARTMTDVLAAAKLRPNDQVWGAYKAWYDKCLQANGAKIREAIERTEAPEKCFRWKVQLDCGCTTEVLTHELLTYGERRFWAREQLPPDGKAKTFLHFGAETGRAEDSVAVLSHGSTMQCADGCPPDSCYGAGHLWCANRDVHPAPLPCREITRWIKRKERWLHADPVEPPDWWAGARENWAKRRRSEGHLYASWTVLLSCGHCCHHIVADADWRSEQGHKPNPRAAAKAREILAQGKDNDGWFEHRLAPGDWPEPSIGEECAPCAYQRRIVAYDPIGPLTKPPPGPPAALERTLDDARARVEHLRAQLAQAESDERLLEGEYLRKRDQ